MAGETSSGARWSWIPLIVGLAAMGFVAVRGCQEGPFGRRQVVALTPQQEDQLGLQAFQEVLAQERGNVIESGPVVDAVKRVAGRLEQASANPKVLELAHLKRRDFKWEVRVVRSKQVNAF